ncbi:anti-sigma factor family protein [Nitrospina gracilis]|uniref:anti-sigma factor family protein n=1 Tax=Nitrospina gracilis TaxID=35801 RepID=UPI001F40F1AB|nr:zf-HC2 domain-containing protein [Nitrospina gracilis]MCF8719707.1 anti-sigma factor RsiW [Nitrospina gracilis Nb-211]
MICCKECIDLLYDYLEGALNEETASALEEHFQDCPPCIAFLNTYKSTRDLCRETLGKIEIPEVVQIKLRDFIKENTSKA